MEAYDMDKRILGIDIGGTTIKSGIFDQDARLLRKWSIPTRKEDEGQHILSDILQTSAKFLQENGLAFEDIQGVGVGIPGPVLHASTVTGGTNLGWQTINIAETLAPHFPNADIRCSNDANAAALGEVLSGAGQGIRDAVMITIGTGIGAGIIIDGKIHNGAFGGGGEIGHLHVNDRETRKCGCGHTGCLEQYCSAPGIVREAKRFLAEFNTPSILRGKNNLTSKDVLDAARSGDAAACIIADRTGDLLGKACSWVSCVLDPALYIFGGGVSNAGDVLLGRIQKAYRKYAFHVSGNAAFRLAALGSDAGIHGAARLVL